LVKEGRKGWLEGEVKGKSEMRAAALQGVLVEDAGATYRDRDILGQRESDR
jgi:hypothetical protein